MRFVLIDGNNFLFAAQHNGSRLTAGGMEVTAVFGFLGSLRNVMERWPNSVPIVLWDDSPSWRMAEYPDYKGNRDKNPQLVKVKEALRPQRPAVKEILNAMGVRQYSLPNQEADDLAGHLSRELPKAGHSVVLVTRDGDWQQLVQKDVIWYDHKNDKVIDHENFEESTGYKDPERFLQGKAIQGDTSDNIPGVGGLGEGSALLILTHYATFKECWDAWEKFEPSIQKNTPWSRYKGKINKAYADPETMVRFGRNLALMDLARKSYPAGSFKTAAKYNETVLKGLFSKLGFHSILRRYDPWMKPLLRGIVK